MVKQLDGGTIMADPWVNMVNDIYYTYIYMINYNYTYDNHDSVSMVYSV